MPVEDALAGVTIVPARAVFADDRVGSLEVGKYADLVVLSADPRKEPSALRKLRVERTVVGGRTVYLR